MLLLVNISLQRKHNALGGSQLVDVNPLIIAVILPAHWFFHVVALALLLRFNHNSIVLVFKAAMIDR